MPEGRFEQRRNPDIATLEAVASGKKPGCKYDSYDDPHRVAFIRRFAAEHDLECESLEPLDEFATEEFVVAKKAKALEVIQRSGLPNIPQLAPYFPAIMEHLKTLSVAEGLAWLNDCLLEECDAIDGPEITVFMGILLGYKPCCIAYFVETRMFHAQRNALEKTDPVDQHILCPECSSKKSH